MDKIWEIAKRIHDYNENCSITGTLMLKIRGIDLGREPKDVDILICDYAPNIKFPPDMKAKQIGQASDGSGAKYQYDGVIIDVLSDGEEPEIIDGWRLGTLKKLLGVKYEYSKQANEDAQKHYNDLIKLGYDFPKT
ncbi:MAG: hypothetical protein ACLFUH_07610, partial [Bacteroidales bacterium]